MRESSAIIYIYIKLIYIKFVLTSLFKLKYSKQAFKYIYIIIIIIINQVYKKFCVKLNRRYTVRESQVYS